jgi:hypothetical protein
VLALKSVSGNPGWILAALLVLALAGCQGGSAGQPAASPPASGSTDTSAVNHSKESFQTEEQPKGKVEVEKPEKPEPAPIKVTDISGHPAERQIVKLLESGKIRLGDDGKFRPNETIKRGEFIEWMYGFDDKGIMPRKPGKPSFPDVQPDNPEYELVEGLQAAGVITGFPDGTLKLDKELTREELCLLWGWYQKAGGVTDPMIPLASAELSLKPYSDRDKVGEIFIRAVDEYLTGHLYTKTFGEAPTLNPQAAVTRAEAARWIVTYYENKNSGSDK